MNNNRINGMMTNVNIFCKSDMQRTYGMTSSCLR